MAKVRFWFTQTASAYADVDIEDPDDTYEQDLALETAYDKVPGGLCYHCSTRMDLSGTWEWDEHKPEVIDD